MRRIASLAQPVQDAAVTTLGDRVYAFGGLDSSGASTATVDVLRGNTVSRAGTLPVAIHDAAAATAGGRLLILGGGQSQSYPAIARFDPASGVTRTVALLPTPLSDLAVATIGDTAYVVGGFTGSAWSDRIEAVRGTRVRVVGRLPVALRYAAVAAVGQDMMIAGGRTEQGASGAIYRFTPSSGSVARIGTLPQPLMHASAGHPWRSDVRRRRDRAATALPPPSVLAVGARGRRPASPHTLSARRSRTPAWPASPGRLVVVGGQRRQRTDARRCSTQST